MTSDSSSAERVGTGDISAKLGAYIGNPQGQGSHASAAVVLSRAALKGVAGLGRHSRTATAARAAFCDVLGGLTRSAKRVRVLPDPCKCRPHGPTT